MRDFAGARRTDQNENWGCGRFAEIPFAGQTARRNLRVARDSSGAIPSGCHQSACED
jgi:hypothetical protein